MHTNDSLADCIHACQQCHDACVHTLHHCLEMGGDHNSYHHIRLLMDCIEMCQTSSNFMLRDSALHYLTCAACAKICEECARDCEQLGPDDEMMQMCAQACRACAQHCREMASDPGHAESHVIEKPAPSTAPQPRSVSTERVAELAQRLYEEAGRPEGRDEEFWYEAETHLGALTEKPEEHEAELSRR